MERPDQIHLRDYITQTEIGAFQLERGVTQRLRFNVTVDLAGAAAGTSDDVDAILSYDVLTAAVDGALADQRFNLLETLAEKIAAEVLRHPRAAEVAVTIEKLDRIPGALGISIRRRAGRVTVSDDAPRPQVLFWHSLDPGAEPVLPQGPLVISPPAPGLPLPGTDRQVALLALDQAAWVLAAHLGLTVADSRTELDWATETGRAVVWAPARMAGDVPGLAADPEILCFWLAERLAARRLLSTRALSPPTGFLIPMTSL
ncbi:MAG: dihydroneopterin aldolase [Paracoccus sp. (in: a-proteobacteria)]|nr:dihydroneopterin aldolase [Paracoccus sp. (in: a-proteobacteria)]